MASACELDRPAWDSGTGHDASSAAKTLSSTLQPPGHEREAVRLPELTKASNRRPAPPVQSIALKFADAPRPSWIGGVKKSEVGGVFDLSNGNRSHGMGAALSKAEHQLANEERNRRNASLVQRLIELSQQPQQQLQLPGAAASILHDVRWGRSVGGDGRLRLPRKFDEDTARLIRLPGLRRQMLPGLG